MYVCNIHNGACSIMLSMYLCNCTSVCISMYVRTYVHQLVCTYIHMCACVLGLYRYRHNNYWYVSIHMFKAMVSEEICNRVPIFVV